ncbi:hypothetical protein AMATHDRAFT_148221 [Amanita thiersii Skay4041]|uniref:Gpi1-domain-containing protein n=1 Tax=Amanita thiersii Skay4041 TaxID=703135 RepID=A0A2A9NN57_9AGAR|nr:hypothetical protein AMATHDRAFT_148221 [Amanita thiersii Skay4041]
MQVRYRHHSRRSRRFYTDDGRTSHHYFFSLQDANIYRVSRFSATLSQAVLRANQAWALLKGTQPYNAFFNTLWLILNDITIGFAIASILKENDIAGPVSHRLDHLVVQPIHGLLQWLDSWPAGLKLNTELSGFYAHSFSLLAHTFRHFVHHVAINFRLIILTSSFFSYLGASFTLAFMIDFLSLLTAYITLSYSLSRLVYKRSLLVAHSLWNLFRGKKYNVLRNRTDYCEYDMDQLLLGTMLFTLLTFLFPTIFAYYSLFAALRLAILLLFASIEILLAFLNHFPLFALVLRIKDPARIPGSLCFQLSVDHQDPHLVLKNQPFPLSAIFSQYIQLASRLATHYNPLRLLYQLFTGEYLAAINYS